MADNLCPQCGMPPGQCYLICPTQDPYGGDQAAENADYEFNARYDDVRERYAATAADADMFDMADDREPCAGGCGVMTEPYAPCGSEQCRDKSNDGEW